MRIIAGTLKGRSLKAPEDSLAVRPTADRAREALFSILQKHPQGAFLDLFAGTGAVGLEAHSRGYGPVTCVERDNQALTCLKANVRAAPVRILAQDVARLKPEAFQGLAVVFADPPYDLAGQLWDTMAARMASWLDLGGVLVFETRAGTTLRQEAGLELLEVRRYGAAEFHLLRRTG